MVGHRPWFTSSQLPAIAFLVASCGGRPALAGDRAVDYAADVKPILTKHCVSCHGEAKPRGGLRLDTAEAARRGGKGGPSIVTGKADESELIAALTGEGRPSGCP